MSKAITWSGIRRSISKVSVLVAGSALLLLVACGGASEQARPTATRSVSKPTQAAEASPVSKPAQSGAGSPVLLEMGTATGANEFKYTEETVEAVAGSKITLKFSNNTDSKDEVGHNWVLVKPGQEDSVLANGIAAGDDKDWLDVDDPGIIAHTRLIEGEQSDSITFDAPAPGSYTYLCTFPEHYAGGMQGTLTIK